MPFIPSYAARCLSHISLTRYYASADAKCLSRFALREGRTRGESNFYVSLVLPQKATLAFVETSTHAASLVWNTQTDRKCLHTFFCDGLECCCGQGDRMVKKLPASYRSSKASEKASYNPLAKPGQATHQAYISTHAASPVYNTGMNTSAKMPRAANTW